MIDVALVFKKIVTDWEKSFVTELKHDFLSLVFAS